MGSWWPLDTHSRAADDQAARHGVHRGDRTEGRRDRVRGAVRRHGGHRGVQVLVWEPPVRLVLSWKPTDAPYDPTEVEVSFSAAREGGTRVELVHRGWERLGRIATEARERYASGWPIVFDERYGRAANAASGVVTVDWPLLLAARDHRGGLPHAHRHVRHEPGFVHRHPHARPRAEDRAELRRPRHRRRASGPTPGTARRRARRSTRARSSTG